MSAMKTCNYTQPPKLRYAEKKVRLRGGLLLFWEEAKVYMTFSIIPTRFGRFTEK